MIEKLIKWEPIQELEKKYFIESLFDLEEFKVNLIDINDSNKKVEILFERSVASYKQTDLKVRLKRLKLECNQWESWTFFQINNSDYIKWISKQSCGISEDRHYKHFAIIANNYVLDIINPSDPSITLINLKNKN